MNEIPDHSREFFTIPNRPNRNSTTTQSKQPPHSFRTLDSKNFKSKPHKQHSVSAASPDSEKCVNADSLRFQPIVADQLDRSIVGIINSNLVAHSRFRNCGPYRTVCVLGEIKSA